MANYKTFTEMPIWQKSHQFSLSVYHFTNKTEFKRDIDLIRQMRRSAVSITSNIAEGHDRSGHKENVYFLNVAKASSAELRSQLILAKDLGYISELDFNSLEKEIIEVNRMLAGFIRYLKNHATKNKINP